MTPQEWATCVAFLRETYPSGSVLSEAGAEIWYALLSDLSYRQVAAAIAAAASRTDAFPSLAAIRLLAESEDPVAGAAWEEVLGYTASAHVFGPIFAGGRLVPWQWRDALVPVALERFQGGRAIALADERQLPQLRLAFIRVYLALSGRPSGPSEAGQRHGQPVSISGLVKALPGEPRKREKEGDCPPGAGLAV